MANCSLFWWTLLKPSIIFSAIKSKFHISVTCKFILWFQCVLCIVSYSIRCPPTHTHTPSILSSISLRDTQRCHPHEQITPAAAPPVPLPPHCSSFCSYFASICLLSSCSSLCMNTVLKCSWYNFQLLTPDLKKKKYCLSIMQFIALLPLQCSMRWQRSQTHSASL